VISNSIAQHPAFDFLIRFFDVSAHYFVARRKKKDFKVKHHIMERVREDQWPLAPSADLRAAQASTLFRQPDWYLNTGSGPHGLEAVSRTDNDAIVEISGGSVTDRERQGKLHVCRPPAILAMFASDIADVEGRLGKR